MKQLSRFVVPVVMLCLIFALLSGCRANTVYTIDQFGQDMWKKGYTFELQDVQQDFLPTQRKRLALQEENIDVYIYASHEDMEKDAQCIDIGGCSYKTENTGIHISWVSLPHFFKKGAIIVQYIGQNETIVSDLTDILGVEFAGYSKIQEMYPPSVSK